MTRSSILGDLLGTLFERRKSEDAIHDKRSIEDLCKALLSEKAEVSSQQMASTILARYGMMGRDDKLSFFSFLNEQMDLDAEKIVELAYQYASAPLPESFKALTHAAEPPRQELFRRLNQAPNATAKLVSMRSDLLSLLQEHPELARTDIDFVHLLRSWFNRGFLVLRQINWESSAAILEKIIAYEAVHEIETWNDLRLRLHPDDRRCFAFFHPAVPDDPLIFVEVALTQGVPSSIQTLLSNERIGISATEADTAVFYSISNCQKGLAGISFGNSLIKQVVRDLTQELPNLNEYITLSPIPGLTRWLRRNGSEQIPDDKNELQKIAADYLLNAKRQDGMPVDPVARFHLGNGAGIYAVHAGADMSSNGIAQSAGTMVNYLYDLKQITQNHQRFANLQEVIASSSVKALAKQASKQEGKHHE